MREATPVPPPPTDAEADIEPGAPVRPAPGQRRAVPWGILDAVGAFIVGFAAIMLIGSIVAGIAGTGALGAETARGLRLPLSGLGVAVGTMLWVAVRHGKDVRLLAGPDRPTGSDLGLGVALGLGGYILVNVVLVLGLAQLIDVAGGELPQVQPELREQAAQSELLPYFVVTTVLVAPLAEELFFRGMLFPALGRRMGLWPAAVVSALAFGAVHVTGAATTGANALVAAMIFPLGVLLAWAYHWRRTLLVPVVIHAMFNGITTVLLLTDIG